MNAVCTLSKYCSVIFAFFPNLPKVTAVFDIAETFIRFTRVLRDVCTKHAGSVAAISFSVDLKIYVFFAVVRLT